MTVFIQIPALFYPIVCPISPSSSYPSWSLPQTKCCFNTRKPPELLSSLPLSLCSFFLPSFTAWAETSHTLWNDTWLGCVLPLQTRAKPHAAIWPISAEGERREIEAGPTFPRHVPHPPGGNLTFLTPSSFVIESRWDGRDGNNRGGMDRGEGKVGEVTSGEGRRRGRTEGWRRWGDRGGEGVKE